MTQPLRRNGVLLKNILRGCEGKRRYSDEFGARAAGQCLQDENQVKLYMYPCKLCLGWHLTKTKQRNEKHDVDYQYPRTRRGA
jgi:hypothetical protein